MPDIRRCFCGGTYTKGEKCSENNCPRQKHGYGCWHKALPKLRKLQQSGQLQLDYPLLDFDALQHHVETWKARVHSRRSDDWITHQRQPHKRGYRESEVTDFRIVHQPDERAAYRRTSVNHGRVEPVRRSIYTKENHIREAAAGSQEHTRRGPRRSNDSPTRGASSTDPVGYRTGTEGLVGSSWQYLDSMADIPEGSEEDEVTVIDVDRDGTSSPLPRWHAEVDSDDSNASLFGLRNELHEFEEVDVLSDSSEDESNHRTLATTTRVSAWRAENSLQDNHDFARTFVSFDEAYANEGRSVAVAWSKTRQWAEPELFADNAAFSVIEATATKIREVDELKKKAKSMPSTAYQRKPGRGTASEEKEKARFIEPLTDLMVDCEVGRRENPGATAEETRDSLRRRATKVAGAQRIPTLHRAITTANELRVSR